MWLLPEKHLAGTVRFVRELQWGAWSLISLYISLASGIIVGLQYDYLTPYYSTTAIDLLIPFGEFFRSVHFYSSQFFFFFCCIHLIAVYPKSGNSNGEWFKLIATLPVILLLLFTGYILRGDSTGVSAGVIAQNIMYTVPLLGQIFDNIFFSLTEAGLRKVYIQHVIGLDLIFLFLAWKHLRTYRVQILEHLPLIGATLLFSALIAAPIEPDKLGITYISGPWFFLGLQELLRYISPFIAGILIPGLFLLALVRSNPQYKSARPALIFLGCWLIAYFLLTTIAWLR